MKKPKFKLGDEFPFTNVRDYWDGPNKYSKDIIAKITCIEIRHTERFTDITYSLGYDWNGSYRSVGRFSERQLQEFRV